MKRILLPFCLFTFLPLNAQTTLSPYLPGVTAEGAVYALPMTGVRVTVKVEKTTYTPGDFCAYAERFLRVRGVSSNPSVSHRILSVSLEPFAVADTSKLYSVKFDARTAAANIALSPDGILLAINAQPSATSRAPRSSAIEAAKPSSSFNVGRSTFNVSPDPRSFLSEEILAAGSTAKMAELTAQDIYEVRESRNLLTRGQADYMPHDGEQLRLMLARLDEQDRAMTSLFTGITLSDTTAHTFTLVPTADVPSEVLFRFSTQLGIVEADDLAGVPYYISIGNLNTVPAPESSDAKKKGKAVQGICINIPGRLRATVTGPDGQTVVAGDFPAGQFGNVELLSAALFNRRYTTRLQLHPLSGAVEKLEAELPK